MTPLTDYPESDSIKKPSELTLRVISSLIMIGLALGALLHGGWPFLLFWTLAATGVAYEWADIANIEPEQRMRRASALVIAASGLTYAVFGTPAAALSALATGALLLMLLADRRRDRLWVASGLVYASIILLVPVSLIQEASWGGVAVAWMFAVVWSTDITAYFTGRAIGGPKLWPRVSPGKTWSGFVGGIIGGTLAGLLVAVIARRFGVSLPLDLLAITAFSCLASIVGHIGDLFESAIKRRFQVKDSGRLIPGHGGFMDRLDAFCAVAGLVGATLALRALWSW